MAPWKSTLDKSKQKTDSSRIITTIALFDIDGLVHHEFVPTGQTVNKEFYKTVPQTPSRRCVQTSPWEVVLRQLNPAPRQRPCPQGCHHKWISGEKQHSFAPTTSLLPWHCSVWLLLVPTTEWNNERSPFRLRWRYSSQRDETTKGYYKKWLPEVLSSVAGALE